MIKEKIKKASKVGAVDTFGTVSSSLILGGLLDYSAGLNLSGILAARASASGMNLATGGIYGWWREKCSDFTNTTKKSSKIKKSLNELLAFNTFQVPIYASALAVGSYISEGEVNFEKVINGSKNLAIISPVIGPVMGWYMDKVRKLFNVEPAAEGAYEHKSKKYKENLK
jgi:hypothetical protein